MASPSREWQGVCAALWRVALACCGDASLAAAVVEGAVTSAAQRCGRRADGDVWRELCLALGRVPTTGCPAGGGLAAALRGLPLPQRLAVALVDVGGLDVGRAAAASGVSWWELRRQRLAGLETLVAVGCEAPPDAVPRADRLSVLAGMG